ncbi:MAG: FIST N-terminal domain-containing protein [Cycloclasticus sp.]
MDDYFNLKTGVSESRSEHIAVDELYTAIYQDDIQFAVFFCSVDYDLPTLERALKDKFTGIKLIGCTTAGELTPEGMMDGTLCGFSINSDQFIAESAIFDMKTIESEASVERMGALQQRVESQAGEGFSALSWLLINSVDSKVERVLGVVDRCFNSMPVVGGSPGGGDDFGATYVYYDGVFQSDAVVVSYLSTSIPFEIFKIDNFEELPRRVVLTEVDTARRIVSGIDGMSAVEGYLAAIDADESELTMEFFSAHPLAAKVGGDLYVRAITPKLRHDEAAPEGCLQFFCAIEEGMVLSTVTTKEALANFRNTFMRLQATHGTASLVLVCDCLYRKFDYQRSGIVADISKIMMGHNVLGFNGYGEQKGVMSVNQTLSGVYFGARD